MSKLDRINNTEVGLAELLQLFAILRPENKETKAFIAGILGLEWKEMKKSLDDLESYDIEKHSSIEKHETKSKINNPPNEPNEPNEHTEQKTPITLLDPIDHGNLAFEILFDDPILTSTVALYPTDLSLHMKSPRHKPLLRNQWFRGLVSAMLATPRDSKDIDLKGIEKYFAKVEVIDRLPWRQIPTLKLGIQLFLDRSGLMQPFLHDEKELSDQLQRLLGLSNVQIWWLEIDKRHFIGSELKWYTPPPSQFINGTPILIVSDFGINDELFNDGVVELEPWLPLLNLAQNYCCPVTALIPAPESFWPAMLKQLIPNAFVWDHDTSIQSIRRSRDIIF